MIERTADRAVIMSILGNDAIWPNIAPPDVAPDDFDPPVDGKYIYLVVSDPEPVALFIYHWTDFETLETHHQVLPEFRGEQSIGYSLESVKWAFDNTNCKQLTCSIPEHYPNVIAHAKKGGFADWYESDGERWLKLERKEWDLSEN